MSLTASYSIFFAAILPAFLLVAYIYYKDKYQREPISQILKGVAYGVISAVIALLLETWLSPIVPDQPVTWLGAIWKGFVGAAIPEELAKLIMLIALLRNNKYFDERFDGIVYAVCIGMGFAATENIIYLFGNLGTWQSVAVGRAFFAVPGHFFFAVAMGYFYSLLYFRDINIRYASQVLLIPVMLHGVYDSLLFMAQTDTMWAGMLLIVFYYFCIKAARRGMSRIKEHLERDKQSMVETYHGHEVEDVEPIDETPAKRSSIRKIALWAIVALFIYAVVCVVVHLTSSDETVEEQDEEEIVVEAPVMVKYPGRSIDYSKKFRDNNPTQLQAARAVGLTNPPATRAQAATMLQTLRKVETNANYVVDSLTHSVPYLVPVAARRLDSIGVEFADILQRNNLPHYRFIVTSVLRTQEDITSLQRTNSNSTKNSCHNYGTTFDLAYFRYDKVTPTNEYMTEDNLKLVLAQVLLNQQRAGKIYVKYEKKQSCFHVTVRR